MKESHFLGGMGIGLMVGAAVAMGVSLMYKECTPVKHGIERMADGVEHMAHRMGM